MELSLVLPCYNEEQNIVPAVEDVAGWMEQQGIDGEIIIVNDGSRDGSAEKLAQLTERFSNVRVVTHETNQGYGLAIVSGLDQAQKEIIGFMDSDRQFRAADISTLLPHLADVDFVTGRRQKRADPFIRNVFGKLLGMLTWVSFGLWVRDINCGMKVFRRRIWPTIRPHHSVEKLFNTELFLGLRQHNIAWKQISVPHYPRPAGAPTGGSLRVIRRMFEELHNLKKAPYYGAPSADTTTPEKPGNPTQTS